MTCRMAAGQQKKPLTSSKLHDQYRGKKKKKVESSDYMLSLRSHISLEWDDTQKKVVAKREQVGIAWMHMAPFVDSVPKSHSGLADVISVPQEIFGLENLTEVLSYEVWATCLSESERKLLMKFLPSGTSAEQVVHSLLTGENHHFGNPFHKWSASLCSGNLHPDVVRCNVRQLGANRKAYYYELKNYHTGMLEILSQCKKRWISCKDPEKLLREGLTKHKQGSLPISVRRAKAAPISKKELPPTTCIRHGDGAKYMSYIKVSRKQYQLIKNIKHSRDGIQFNSLSRVLRDIKGFHMQPYKTFEEKEKKRLHDHWVQLATKDVPAAFEYRRDKKLQREQWGKSLEQELAEKRKLIVDMDEETRNLESSPREQVDTGDSQHPATGVLVPEDFDSTLKATDHLERIPSLGTHQELSPIVLDQAAVGKDLPKPLENSRLSHFLGEKDPPEVVAEPMSSFSSPKDMLQAASVFDYFYQTTPEGHGYTSAAELSLFQPQPVEEHPVPVIDLERDMLEQEARHSVEPLFCSYSNQDHSELLPSYPHQHMNEFKQPQLQFLMANNSSGPGQFPNDFQQPIQVRDKELCMHQMMNKNAYINGTDPSQGFLGLTALQSTVNGGLVGRNWFPGDHWVSNGLSGVEPTVSRGQYLGGGGSVDGSLFSVLSGCNSNSPYNTTISEQFIQARNCISREIPCDNSIHRQFTHQIRNPSSFDAAAAAPSSNESWMNFLHQNPSLLGSKGRTFL